MHILLLTTCGLLAIFVSICVVLYFKNTKNGQSPEKLSQLKLK